ncbi:MAG TPA: hypothetical protein VHU22_23915 [Xanthobacteraceae bacterium]|jgi:ElaB/YqjD/DUF883 family membrane-anchored ribosome-binding protein|nr:hypothetical protein [Xanthobacteraceae bacterium]
MTTASSATQNIRGAANDTVREARDGVRDIGKAAAGASADLQDDLNALRDDFGKLAEQVREILSARGQAAWQSAMSGLDDVVAEARDSGRTAAGAAREATDRFTGALDDTIKERPYTTLAVVAGLAFLFGITWRR